MEEYNIASEGVLALDAAIRERHNVEKEGKLAESRIVEVNQKTIDSLHN